MALTAAIVGIVLLASALSPPQGGLPHDGWGGCVPPGPSEIRFEHQSVQTSLVDGEYRWNVTMEINFFYQFDAEVMWSSLQAAIIRVAREDHNISAVTYIPMGQVVPRPAMMPDRPVVFYEERSGEAWSADPGDVIGVAGADRSLQGCQAVFNVEEEHFGHGRIGYINPFFVPWFEEAFSVKLGDCTVGLSHFGTHRWYAVVPVASVTPAWERVSWGAVRMVNSSDDMDPGSIPLRYPGEGSITATGWSIYYDETGQGDGFIGPGDLIRIPDVPSEMSGHYLAVMTGVESVCFLGISQLFPSPVLNITLGSPTMSQWYNGDGYYSAAEFNVTSVSPSLPTVEWTSAMVQVRRFQGSSQWFGPAPDRPLSEYNAATHDNADAFYLEGGAGDGRISVGDRILVANLGTDRAGGLVVVLLEGFLMGSGRLPFILPGLGPIVTFRWGPPVERVVGDVHLYDITMTVTDLKVTGLRMPWADLRLSISGGGSDSNHTMRADPGAYGSGLGAWFVDREAPGDSLDPGDRIRLTGLSTSRPAISVVLWYEGQDVGGGTYPDPFDPRTGLDFRDAVVTLGPIELGSQPVNGTPSWRVTVPVISVAPDGLVLPLVHLRLIVVGNATYLRFNQTLAVFDPADHPGGWGEFNTDAPCAWFIDVGEADGAVDVGDMIGITGMTEAYEGGYLALWVQNHYTCNLDLPDAFA